MEKQPENSVPSFGPTEDKILAGLRAKLPVSKAVEAAGVTRQTFYRWCVERPDFKQAADALRGPVAKTGLTGGKVINPSGKGGFQERPQDTGGKQGLITVAHEASRVQTSQRREKGLATKDEIIDRVAGKLGRIDDEILDRISRRLEASRLADPNTTEIPLSKPEHDTLKAIRHDLAGLLPREVASDVTVNRPNENDGYTFEQLMQIAEGNRAAMLKMADQRKKAQAIEAECREVESVH